MENQIASENISNGLVKILDLDTETESKLKVIGINTASQLLLCNLKEKGISKKKLAEIYSKCRERITSFPNSMIHDVSFSSLSSNLNNEFGVGFKSGTNLLQEARNQWRSNNNSGVNLGSDCLMDFFNGGLLLGEITELFGQDLSVIRRAIHWMISKTMFYSCDTEELCDKKENFSCCNVLYIQTTSNSFDPIYIKECFEKLLGENEHHSTSISQLSQNVPKLSGNIQHFLSNISVVTVRDYNQLANIFYNIQNLIRNELNNLRLVVIDSITAIAGTHVFFEDKDTSLPPNKHFKDMKDTIFAFGKLLRYTCKVLNISCIVTALVRQSPKLNQKTKMANGIQVSTSNSFTASSQKLLSDFNSPKTVIFTRGNYSFEIPPPTSISTIEIDQSWLQFPHNRVLVENICNFNPERAAILHNRMHASFPHNARILRWTMYKSSRIPIGKYICTIQEKVGTFESDCQFT